MESCNPEGFGSHSLCRDLARPGLGTGRSSCDVWRPESVLMPAESSAASGNISRLAAVHEPGGSAGCAPSGPGRDASSGRRLVSAITTVQLERPLRSDPEIPACRADAAGEGGLRPQKHIRHGSFREEVWSPTENAKPIGPIAGADAARWCALGSSRAVRRFLRRSLHTGLKTVMINGATGIAAAPASAVALRWGGLRQRDGPERQALEDLRGGSEYRLRT